MNAKLNNTSIITLSWKAIIETNVYGVPCRKLPMLIHRWVSIVFQILSNSVLKYASFIKNCTPGWALLNQNLTPLKVNASLKSKFNTQKTLLQLSKTFSTQTTNYGSRISTLCGHTSKAIYDRYKVCNAPFKNKHNSFVVPYAGSYCFCPDDDKSNDDYLFINFNLSAIGGIWLETTPLHS